MLIWRLRRRVRRDPDDATARLALAHALHAAGDPAEARAEARAALTLTLTPDEHLELADLLTALDCPADAAHIEERLWRTAPDHPDAAARHGRRALRDGRPQDALDALRHASAQAESDDTLRRELITALRATGATAEAARHLGELTRRHPDDPALLIEYGQALLATHDPTRALEALRRAHRLAPRDERAAITLGVALGRTGAGNEAVVVLERYLADQPQSLSALINCGVAYGEIGDQLTAVRYLLDASHRAPHIAAIQQNLAVVFARMGQLGAAIDALRIATRLDPASATWQLQLAHLLARQGDLHDAIAAATLAGNLAPAASATERAARELRDELKTAVASEYPAHPHTSDGPDRPSAMSGVLTEFPLPNLLEFLRSDRRTGLLQIVSISGVAEIRLRGGDITSVSASLVPRLGELLLRAGHLDRPALEDALGSRPPGRPLGQHLIDRGLVAADHIHDTAREQALQALIEILPWEQGQFSFIREDGPAVPESWSTQGLLLDALRRLDEDGYADAAGSIELVGELFGEPPPDILDD